MTLDIPKIKNNNRISVSLIPLSFRNAGYIDRIIPKDDVQNISKIITSGNLFISLIDENENRS